MVTPINCNSGFTGAIDLNPTGGTPAYSFQWTADNGFTSTDQNISMLTEGNYTAEVTDQNGCIYDTTISLLAPPPIFLSFIITDVTCNGEGDGAIEISVSGGMPPYTYLWTGPNGFISSDEDLFFLDGGVYHLQLTDFNGCDFEFDFTVNEPPAIDISATITDILCKGDSTGMIATVVSGGAGNFIYEWTDENGVIVGNDDTLQNVTAGTYTYLVTDMDGCTATADYAISEPATAVTITLNSIDADCAGNATGSVSVLVSGGDAGSPDDYTIEWTDENGNVVGNTQVINNLPPGVYFVTVSDLSNCMASGNVEISSPDPIVLSFDITNPLCNGDATGSAVVTPSGGVVSGDYFYFWENTANPGLIISITNQINNVPAGIYQVEVFDDNFCSTLALVTISEPDPITFSFSFTEPFCNGDNNGQIEVAVSGGTIALDYQYEWMDDASNIIGNTALISNLTAGNYSLTVTDDNGCQYQEDVILGEPDLINFDPLITQITCAGDDNGSIDVLVSGGIPPYLYQWTDESGNNIGNSSMIENLAPGNYTLTVTDDNNCEMSETYTISPLNEVTATFTQFELGDCSIAPPCTGAAFVEVSGGSGIYVNYEWTDVLGNDMGINNDTATGLCSGSYLVTITDSEGCSGSVLVLINDVMPETISVNVEDPTCNATPGTAIAVYECMDEPCSIEWFDAVTNSSLGLVTDTVELPAGDYFVQITNGTGCKSYFAFSVTEPLPLVPNSGSTGITCNGTCDGTAFVSPTGASGSYTYQWNDPMGQTAATATGLCAGTYEVIITDAVDENCFIVAEVMVDDIAPITYSDTVTHVSCNGGSNGEIALYPQGGTGVYTFTWIPEPPIGNGTSTGSGLAAGEYTIIIADAGNPACFIEVVDTITQPDSLMATTDATESTCGNADGTITVSPFGGTPPYSYLWNDPAGQTTATATNLVAGIYQVLVTDSLGCSELFADAVSDQDADTLDISIEPGFCFGDSSTVIATYDCLNPVCTITWYDELGNLLPVSGDTAVLADGNYWVGIENGLGCKWFLFFEVQSVPPIQPNLFTLNESCNGPCDGIAAVNPTGGNGGYSYLWSPEPPAGQGTNQVSGLCAGTWQVTITDVAGCDTTVVFEIGPESPIEPNLTFTNVGCSGESSAYAEVSPSGGNGFYNYLWSPDPGMGQGTSMASGLYAGEWSITVTDTSGCDTTLLFTITEPLPLEADSMVTNASCNTDPGDGEIILIVDGGTPPFEYQWFDAAGNDLNVNNDTIGNLAEGIYHCIVTDSNNCSETFVAIVSEQTGEDIAVGSTNVVCFGADDGTAWVTYECTDAPCTVSWYDELGIDLGLNTDTITGLGPGIYIVGVTNASGCITYMPVEVTEPPPLTLTMSITDASCSGVCDGIAVADVSGGIEPYSYLWTPEPGSGQFTNTASQLCAGDYSLLMTDAAGCEITFDFTIGELESIVSNLQTGDANCFDACDGWATVDPAGVSGNYSYLWLPEPPSGQGTDSIAGLCAGEWTVLITDLVNGCNITDTFQIAQPDSIWISDTLITEPECLEDNSGIIAILAEGGNPPYSYQWYENSTPVPGANDTALTDVPPGEYEIEITDANGCVYTESYMLESTSVLIADAGNDTAYCEGNGPAVLIGSGNGLTHIWFDEDGNLLEMNDTLVIDPDPGLYPFIFEVSDGICSLTDTAWVEVYSAPETDAGPDLEIFTDESTIIGGNPTGPPNSTYAWWPATWLNDSTLANPLSTPAETIQYIVVVTEPDHGCMQSDSMTVTVVPKFVPNNGFTPNGDGINDVWIIGNIKPFPDIEVMIFNRWGEKLFSSTGYDTPWDGTYNGKPVPVGTYYYVIDLHDEKYPEPFTGPLTIMR